MLNDSDQISVAKYSLESAEEEILLRNSHSFYEPKPRAVAIRGTQRNGIVASRRIQRIKQMQRTQLSD